MLSYQPVNGLRSIFNVCSLRASIAEAFLCLHAWGRLGNGKQTFRKMRQPKYDVSIRMPGELVSHKLGGG